MSEGVADDDTKVRWCATGEQGLWNMEMEGDELLSGRCIRSETMAVAVRHPSPSGTGTVGTQWY